MDKRPRQENVCQWNQHKLRKTNQGSPRPGKPGNVREFKNEVEKSGNSIETTLKVREFPD
jgi:hypothetical protein